MKVIFFTTYYEGYLKYFYEKNPLLYKATYAQQMQSILDDYFVYWGGHVNDFISMGIDAQLIIPNCKSLQYAWARENNFKFSDRDWLFAIPLEQIKKECPDVLYMGSNFEYYGEFINKANKYAKNVFGWISCVVPSGIKANQLQLILSSLPYYVENFRREGLNSEFLNASFDSRILRSFDESQEADIDFSFVGSLTNDHKNRIEIITQLLLKTNLKVFGRDTKLTLDERTPLQKIFYKPKAYLNNVMGAVYGLDMYKILRRSKITFNKHIDIAKEFIGNARTYEATGVGTLLLTDGKSASIRPFNENEVVYYDTIDDAIEKMRYYLSHENERLKIANEGQNRTLTDYSCTKASKILYEYFLKYRR